jgi:hypothetical protein
MIFGEMRFIRRCPVVTSVICMCCMLRYMFSCDLRLILLEHRARHFLLGWLLCVAWSIMPALPLLMRGYLRLHKSRKVICVERSRWSLQWRVVTTQSCASMTSRPLFAHRRRAAMLLLSSAELDDPFTVASLTYYETGEYTDSELPTTMAPVCTRSLRVMTPVRRPDDRT